jgi:YegS/Rv2252/BmrU family lipid kinase
VKTLLIVNPASADGDTGRRWGSLGSIVARHLSDFHVVFTKASGEATAITRHALKTGTACVVAVGGDGTLNEVVNGFFENEKPIRAQACVGLLPRGTGGDFRRTLDWTTDFESAVRRLTGTQTTALDIGSLRFDSHQGKPSQRYFANVCSFGVSGLVDQEVNKTTKVLGGKASFLLGSLKAMRRYDDKLVRFSLDGGPATETTVTTLSVANGKFFGGGMKVAPEANVSDGIFDVTLWQGYGVKDFVLKSPSIYSGKHTQWAGTKTFRCQVLEATSKQEVLIDCDGEQPGRLPCTVTLVPRAITLKV